ncbi:hypothetical protein TVAGG3_0767280 [Trichomonas vaginalis G3]|uniref:hypothetical protein n=1 Tax=Trichomonas vaginalis (strain ATCC PRA-98 / G3) TaxID=412133 RepID=UPI0021E5C0A3|nr:hypothetical protein TVAGG3_0767280 [Trichomonas vaginalis G3]KAI5513589.1 hypothetical protein TVAGG3_0767280 [Trichomonas vaginalis G3]
MPSKARRTESCRTTTVSSATSVPASTSELLPISTSRLLPTTRLPELPSSAYALLPQPLVVPASSTLAIQFQSQSKRDQIRRRSEPLTQRVCYSSNGRRQAFSLFPQIDRFDSYHRFGS